MAFVILQMVLYQFDRLPIGLSGGPATFNSALEKNLAGLQYDNCLCYFGAKTVRFLGRPVASVILQGGGGTGWAWCPIFKKLQIHCS